MMKILLGMMKKLISFYKIIYFNFFNMGDWEKIIKSYETNPRPIDDDDNNDDD